MIDFGESENILADPTKMYTDLVCANNNTNDDDELHSVSVILSIVFNISQKGTVHYLEPEATRYCSYSLLFSCSNNLS